MSIIAAAAMRVRTMADGSLRVEVQVEPADAQAAFALFGRPGAPMALAALHDGYAKASDAPAAPEPAPPAKRAASPKPIAQWLAMMCKRPEFQRWMCGPDDASEANAAQMCRTACGVESRGDIDGSAVAEKTFREQIQHPWQKFCADHGITFKESQ